MARTARCGTNVRIAGVAVLFLALGFGVAAHDIPNDVTVQAFVRPQGRQLRLVVRLPLITLNPNGAPIANVDIPERGPGYLDLAHVDPMLRRAATGAADILKLYEDDSLLSDPTLVAARVSLLSDKSFASYDEAIAHVTGPPLPVSTDLYWNQGFVDAILEFGIRSDRSNFAIDPAVQSLGNHVLTILRFVPPGGGIRAYEFPGSVGVVRLDPRWYHSVRTFVKAGLLNSLGGIDLLLFLFCLVMPIRCFRALIPVVASFTAAHSITLIASAYDAAPGGAWFPPLIGTLIAFSIVYMAVDNIIGAKLQRRLFIAFGFGLVHGFGFSFALRDILQFGKSHFLISLLSFNIGVELGQIIVLAVLIPALTLVFGFMMSPRMGTVILSAFVADTSWHWLGDRAQHLALVEWPRVEILLAVRWVLLLAGLLIMIWLVFESLRRREPGAAPTVSLESEEAARVGSS